MSALTHIEWTDRTWNFVTGCTKVSRGCDNCYIARTPPFRMNGRKFDKPGIGGSTGLVFHEDRIVQPLRVRKPQRWFVNSLADLFHKDVPLDLLIDAFAVMALTPQHTYQILTKRPDIMRSRLSKREFWYKVGRQARHMGYAYDKAANYFADGRNIYDTSVWEALDYLPNVWLGTSVEDQETADRRIPALLMTPAAVRWLSCEPLLGPVNLTRIAWTKGGGTNLDVVNGLHGVPDVWHAPGKRVDWVVVGGESGPGARAMHPHWARSLRDQCTAAGVPFLMKQWGEWGPAQWKVDRISGESDDAFKARAEAIGATHVHTHTTYERDGETVWHLYEPNHKPWSLERGRIAAGDVAAPIRRWGKKKAGRQLDGREWNQYPETVTV